MFLNTCWLFLTSKLPFVWQDMEYYQELLEELFCYYISKFKKPELIYKTLIGLTLWVVTTKYLSYATVHHDKKASSGEFIFFEKDRKALKHVCISNAMLVIKRCFRTFTWLNNTAKRFYLIFCSSLYFSSTVQCTDIFQRYNCYINAYKVGVKTRSS